VLLQNAPHSIDEFPINAKTVKSRELGHIVLNHGRSAPLTRRVEQELARGLFE